MSVNSVQAPVASPFQSFIDKKQANAQNKTQDKKSPSTARMMGRYGGALTATYALGHLGTTFIQAKRAGKKFRTFCAEKLFDSTQKALSKGFKKGDKSFLGVILRMTKFWLIIGAVGAGLGVLMKNQLDKNPNNKVLKGINSFAEAMVWLF